MSCRRCKKPVRPQCCQKNSCVGFCVRGNSQNFSFGQIPTEFPIKLSNNGPNTKFPISKSGTYKLTGQINIFCTIDSTESHEATLTISIYKNYGESDQELLGISEIDKILQPSQNNRITLSTLGCGDFKKSDTVSLVFTGLSLRADVESDVQIGTLLQGNLFD